MRKLCIYHSYLQSGEVLFHGSNLQKRNHLYHRYKFCKVASSKLGNWAPLTHLESNILIFMQK